MKAAGARGKQVQVTIKNAHGGSPDKIVKFARIQASLSAFDQVAILFDEDKPLSSAGEKMAKSMRAQLFRFQPCIEGFYLGLMGRAVPGDTPTCKREFHLHGLDEKTKLDHESYAPVFPLDRISHWNTHPQFAALWRLFTNTKS